jgi:hypothetical protein
MYNFFFFFFSWLHNNRSKKKGKSLRLKETGLNITGAHVQSASFFTSAVTYEEISSTFHLLDKNKIKQKPRERRRERNKRDRLGCGGRFDCPREFPRDTKELFQSFQSTKLLFLSQSPGLKMYFFLFCVCVCACPPKNIRDHHRVSLDSLMIDGVTSKVR